MPADTWARSIITVVLGLMFALRCIIGRRPGEGGRVEKLTKSSSYSHKRFRLQRIVETHQGGERIFLGHVLLEREAWDTRYTRTTKTLDQGSKVLHSYHRVPRYSTVRVSSNFRRTVSTS